MVQAALPSGWEDVKLKDIATTIKEKIGNRAVETLSISAGIGFVNQAEKFGKELSGKQYEHYTVLNHGDFSYNKGNSKRYPQGCIYKLTDRMQAAVPNVFISFRINAQNEDFYEQLFVGGYLNSQLKKIITSGARGDGLLNVSNTDFFDCIIPLPPLSEQRAIAEILTTADRLITVKERLITAKQKQKRWLMQNLLTGKVRLPGFSGEWKRRKLGSYLIEHNEISDETNQYPVLTSSRRGIYLQSEYYKKEIASEDNTGYNVVPYGYFTYRHMSDDEIFRFNINTLVEKGIVSTLYPVFTTRGIDEDFLLAILNEGHEFRRFARLQKQGGSRTYMYFSKLLELSLTLPPLPEQTAIAAVLTAADREIELLTKELEQQKQTKKYLMQQLLTGKIRVKGATAQ